MTKTHSLLRISGIFLTVFGIKLAMINFFGVSSPDWDQWEEISNFRRPLAEGGRLEWKYFFEAYNEHRTLLPRLLGLALQMLNQLWDSQLEMVVNATLHSLIAIFLYKSLGKGLLTKKIEWLWMLLILAVFGLPLGWETTLGGSHQFQCYLVILFTTLSIRFFSYHDPLTLRWFVGVAMAIAGYFSMASGLLSAVAGAGIIIVRVSNSRKLNWSSIVGLGILFLLVGLGYKFTPSIEAHMALRASSIVVFLKSFLSILSYPVPNIRIIATLLWFPFFLLLLRCLLGRRGLNKQDLFVLGLGMVIFLQAGALAFGRGGGAILASRYLDMLLLGVLANFVAIVLLLKESLGKKPQRFAVFATIWVCLIAYGFWSNTTRNAIRESISKGEEAQTQEANLRGYLATNDLQYIFNKPFRHIPYPSAEGLKRKIDIPVIRSIMPSSITPPIPGHITENFEHSFEQNGYSLATRSRPHENVFGSYGKKGESQKGKIIIRYTKENSRTSWIRIPLAGYPLENGESLKVRSLSGRDFFVFYPLKNPEESWKFAYARVPEMDFFIEAVDESETSWFAFASPKEEGRVRIFLELLLNSWQEVVGTGMLLLLITLIPSLYNLFNLDEE